MTKSKGIAILTFLLMGTTHQISAQLPEVKCPEDQCDVIDKPECNMSYRVKKAIEDCTIDPSTVGDKKAPDCIISYVHSAVSRDLAKIIIKANGIPNHDIGMFGTATVTPCGRPNELEEQDYYYEIVVSTSIKSDSEKEYSYFVPPRLFGMALNGIPFDPEAAEWYKCIPGSNWQKSALDHPDMQYDLDCNNGHIQGDRAEHPGAYHYHGFPKGLYEKLGGTYPIPNESPRSFKTDYKIILLGWGFDGIPVYGPLCMAINSGNWQRPSSGWKLIEGPELVRHPCDPPDAYTGHYDVDYEYAGGEDTLDECNGHFAKTPEFPDGIYHYHITMEYPYIPRCFTTKK